MPNGFGLYRGTTAQQASLGRVRTGSSADDLVKAAAVGVERLGAAQGLKLVPHTAQSSDTWERAVIFAGGAVILVLLGVLTYAQSAPRRTATN